jgi:hypothetical protein
MRVIPALKVTDEAEASSVSLCLDVDFERKVLYGK